MQLIFLKQKHIMLLRTIYSAQYNCGFFIWNAISSAKAKQNKKNQL